MKRFLKPGRLVIYFLLGVWFLFSRIGAFFSGGSLGDLNTTVLVNEGETLSHVFEQVSSGVNTMKLKRFLKNNPEVITTLQPGSYIFSGAYSFEDFFAFLEAGPQVAYASVTLLEGRSIYDIDAALTRKEYIYEGGYVEVATNELLINKYINRYEFLELAAEDGGLTTLEGFLYPETYFIDVSKDFIDQLIYLQLESYKTNVWEPLKNRISAFQPTGIETTLSFYEMMILASVIEKEERVDENKADIASVFFNRLDNSMRIDADITLCYGLETPYDDCPPSVIAQNLGDSSNLYNTRAVGGLPPTPIANIHVNSLTGLLDVEKSDYFFYLHDDTGRIHLGKDLSEHNINKSKYID